MAISEAELGVGDPSKGAQGFGSGASILSVVSEVAMAFQARKFERFASISGDWADVFGKRRRERAAPASRATGGAAGADTCSEREGCLEKGHRLLHVLGIGFRKGHRVSLFNIKPPSMSRWLLPRR